MENLGSLDASLQCTQPSRTPSSFHNTLWFHPFMHSFIPHGSSEKWSVYTLYIRRSRVTQLRSGRMVTGTRFFWFAVPSAWQQVCNLMNTGVAWEGEGWLDDEGCLNALIRLALSYHYGNCGWNHGEAWNRKRKERGSDGSQAVWQIKPL